MRIWLITGASRGFGALVAQRVLDAGDAVVATSRKASDISLVASDPERLLVLPLDVTNEAQARETAAAALARYGRIDVLVNNAGYGLLGGVEEASAEEVQSVFATNVFGLLNVTRAVLPSMRERRAGHVVNFSSVGGYQAYPGWGVYGATKFAVEGLSEALAAELRPLGVKVTVVEPGFFRTDFLSPQSLSSTQAQIDDYAETVGAMRVFAAGADHQQPGNPAKLADAMLAIAQADEPPLRLPLGSDTVARIEAKHRFVEQELAAWRSLALSTDFSPAAVA